MPSVHIPEGPFRVLSNELGYEGAKERVKALVHEEAERVGGKDDE